MTKINATTVASLHGRKAPLTGPVPKLPRRLDPNARIRLVVTVNPKLHGTLAWEKFNAYRSGMTVGEALDTGLIKRSTIRWDVARRFIRLD